MFLRLSEIKKHLNIDTTFVEDDNYLLELANVCENIVQKHIDHNLSDLKEDGQLPSPLIHAMLLMVASFYAKRESIAFAATSEVPLSYEYLLSLYKDYNGPHEGTPNIKKV